MSGFFGGATTSNTLYAGIQIASNTAALPVPIVWGQNMLTPICIDYRNFRQDQVGGKGGGKGGLFGGGSSSSETIYRADVLLAICEGPIADVPYFFQGTWTPLSIELAGLLLQEVGAIGQAPNTAWIDVYPAYALGYSGIAYLQGIAFDLGPSATLGNNQLVVDGQRYGTGPNGLDADPSLVISDFLNSTQFGVGFTAPIVGLTGASGDSSLQSYCQAAGLCFSPILSDREAANSILDRWLQLLNCTCIWSSGQLVFIPRGDTAITANGWTFNPNLTVQYALNDDSYAAVSKGKQSDPVQVIRSDPYDIDNYVILEIVGRGDSFNTGPIPVFDQAAIDKYGLKVGSSISAHEICDPLVAQTSAQLILQRGLYIRRTFTFKLSWEYCLLDPMDVVTVSDSRIGLAATPVRIQAIEEDEDGLLTVTAEELPIGVATAAPYAIQAASNGTPDGQIVPQPVNTPVIWEPPLSLTGGTVQIWAAVSPGGDPSDPNWGGAIVNVSFDGTSYQSISTLYGRSIQGVLLANLATYSGANPDTTNTLSVNLIESGGALVSTTAANAAAGATLCLVDNEYIAFETATLVTNNEFNLTMLYRGLFGSTPAAHSSGASFVYVVSPLVKYTLPTAEIGMGLFFKFQSFNSFGAQLQSLASAVAYPYGTITGVGTGSASYTPAWTQAGVGAPTLGNGTLTGSYARNGAGTFVSVNISLVIGSTTTVTPGPGSAGWEFSTPFEASAGANGNFTVVSSGGASNSGAVLIPAGGVLLHLYGSANVWEPGAVSPGDTYSISITYPT